jgi:hypothetical protein
MCILPFYLIKFQGNVPWPYTVFIIVLLIKVLALKIQHVSVCNSVDVNTAACFDCCFFAVSGMCLLHNTDIG